MSLMFEIHAVGGNTSVPAHPVTTLEQAKARGLEAAVNGACVWIEGLVDGSSSKRPVPMWGFRYDKAVSSWVETSLPFNIEEFFNASAPRPL